MIVALVLALVVTGWVHYRLAFQIPNKLPLWAGRLMLLLVGTGFGWAMSQVYTDSRGIAAVWVFLTSFGAAHLPAAILLWIKKQRNTRGI